MGERGYQEELEDPVSFKLGSHWTYRFILTRLSCSTLRIDSIAEVLKWFVSIHCAFLPSLLLTLKLTFITTNPPKLLSGPVVSRILNQVLILHLTYH